MERSCRTWHSRSVQRKCVYFPTSSSFRVCLFIFSYLLIAAMVLLVSWQIDQCYFPVSLTCISGGIREEPVNPEVIGHRSDEIEMATGLVEHRSRTD